MSQFSGGFEVQGSKVRMFDGEVDTVIKFDTPEIAATFVTWFRRDVPFSDAIKTAVVASGKRRSGTR